MATIIQTLLYPKTEDSTFNLDYYLSSHMATVEKNWGPIGLKGFKVVEFTEGPYAAQCVMEWENMDAFNKAKNHPAAIELYHDIPNYTNQTPIVIMGEQKN